MEARRAFKTSGCWLACITSATGSPSCWARPPTPRAHPHLAEAVLTYGKHGFSIATSAKDLHPNTVTYRLDRWQHLTGWNPRSLDGLLNSVVGLNLYPTDTGGADANRTGGAAG